MNIIIENRPMAVVYGLRHIGPYEKIGNAFYALWEWLCQHNLQDQVTSGVCIGYDNPNITPADACRADVCYELKGEPPFDLGPAKRIEIPAGRYANHRHIGSYAGLEAVYQSLMGKGLSEKGLEFSGEFTFEVYRNNPNDTPEDQLMTDIYIPLKS